MSATVVFILNLVVIFIVKVFDNLLSTSKTILVQKSIAITAYAETKAQSKLIDEYLDSLDVKVKRIISKN